MTLHSRASLASAVAECLAGTREPRSPLEQYAIFRAFREGYVPSLSYDGKRATQEGIDRALEQQAYEAAPPAVKASPALLRLWLVAAANDRAKTPLVEGQRRLESLTLTERPPEGAVRPELKTLEDSILGTRHTLESEDREAALAEAWETGRFGVCGKLLDNFSHADRCKVQTVDAAFEAGEGLILRLAAIRVASLSPGAPLAHFPLQIGPRHLPHSAVCGERVQLGWLCHVPADAPPKVLYQHGSWEHTDLASRPGHGVWIFSPTTEAQ